MGQPKPDRIQAREMRFRRFQLIPENTGIKMIHPYFSRSGTEARLIVKSSYGAPIEAAGLWRTGSNSSGGNLRRG